jgi:ribosomal protein S18 acetylase RimI-like enzyme
MEGTTVAVPVTTVTLVSMKSDVWEVWRESSIREYAAAKVRAGTWPADEALGRAERAFSELLPQGLATPANELRSIIAADGTDVGAVWLGPRDSAGSGTCYIWDIVVRPDARGRGFGRAALLALEPLARSLGYDAIGLHVFGDNAVARQLYRTAGYSETDVTMVKALG